jgi:hypothetical protein
VNGDELDEDQGEAVVEFGRRWRWKSQCGMKTRVIQGVALSQLAKKNLLA